MFSVNVLLYGDHLPLAQRCLESIVASADWSLIEDVRLGLNQISPVTLYYVEQTSLKIPVPVYFFRPRRNANVGKYPLMRRMLYSCERPMTASHVMWFDDDSYIRESHPAWWHRMLRRADCCDLVGKRYRIGVNGGLRRAIAAQPWYDRHVGLPSQIKFCQGGWWIANFAKLQRWMYPFPELYHNGGDVILGELARQQGWSMDDTNDGVAINADEAGIESAAKRRGLTTTPLWRDYSSSSPTAETPSHQIFDYDVKPGNHAPRHPLDRSGS